MGVKSLQEEGDRMVKSFCPWKFLTIRPLWSKLLSRGSTKSLVCRRRVVEEVHDWEDWDKDVRVVDVLGKNGCRSTNTTISKEEYHQRYNGRITGCCALTKTIMAQDTHSDNNPFCYINLIFIKVANNVFLVNRGKISNFELQTKKVVNRGSKFSLFSLHV